MFNSKCGCHPEADSLLIITVVRPRGFLYCSLGVVEMSAGIRENGLVDATEEEVVSRKKMGAGF